MFSVLKKPTTTSTTPATTYITTSAVPRTDTAPVPPGNEVLPQPSMKDQSQTAWLCQPYDAFLVLDVEATCLQGTGFHWPNEIIVRYRLETRSHRSVKVQEWPVCLLKWADRWDNGMVGPLKKVAEFRSFVKPTWRPKLSSFCVSLTGITQVSSSNSVIIVHPSRQPYVDLFRNRSMAHPIFRKSRPSSRTFSYTTASSTQLQANVSCGFAGVPMARLISGTLSSNSVSSQTSVTVDPPWVLILTCRSSPI